MKIDAVNVAEILEEFLKDIAQDILKLDAARDKEENAFWQVFYLYKEELSRIIDFLSRVDSRYSRLKIIHGRLGSGGYMNFGGRKQFQEVIRELIEKYREFRFDLIGKLSTLHDDEKERLNEAYHTLKEDCFWSSIANCSVLLESRILKILKRKNSKFLKTKNKQLRFSFGELVDIYLDNKHKFKNCIPQKHDHVLKLLNKYRIVSVHAKQVAIDQNEANALFNLTLSFIFDPKCVVAKRKSGKKK